MNCKRIQWEIIKPQVWIGERPVVVTCVCESVTALCSVWRGLNHATCLANHSAEATLELPLQPYVPMRRIIAPKLGCIDWRYV